MRYQLRKSGHITIEIYDILGQRVRTLVDLDKPLGHYSVVWDGKNDRGQFVNSGIYFYEMEIGDFRERQKVVFLK